MSVKRIHTGTSALGSTDDLVPVKRPDVGILSVFQIDSNVILLFPSSYS